MRREKSGARKVRLEKWVEKSEAKRRVGREEWGKVGYKVGREK